MVMRKGNKKTAISYNGLGFEISFNLPANFCIGFNSVYLKCISEFLLIVSM